MTKDKTYKKETEGTFNQMQKAFNKALQKRTDFVEKVVNKNADSALQERRKKRL